MPAKKSVKQSAKKGAGKAAKAAAAKPDGIPTTRRRPQYLINVDLAKVYDGFQKGKKFLTVLGWGDEVVVRNPDEIEDGTAKYVAVRATKYVEQPDKSIRPQTVTGYITPPKGVKASRVVAKIGSSRVLKVDFVDVQQGDGAIIITPNGKTVLIDGGDNQMFARYLANRFNRFGWTKDAPKEIDCILVTHGDADHFAGLNALHQSETARNLRGDWKRIFISPQRYYHNGLVKRPSKDAGGAAVPDEKMLGETTLAGSGPRKTRYVTGLVDSLFDVPAEEMNKPFREWRAALESYNERRKRDGRPEIVFKRLEKGMDKAFDFLNDGVSEPALHVKVEVVGPLTTKVDGAPALKFLGNPPKGPRLGKEVLEIEGGEEFTGASASHTINGHSVIFRLTYGNFRFLFTGDLNDEAGRALARAHEAGSIDLQSEVFKVPHHGSADFSGRFLQQVAPLISVVSSGDESARKEYVHPRATVIGALGKYSRLEEPLVFVTELVAFFELAGLTQTESHKLKNGVAVVENGAAVEVAKNKKTFFAFKRTAYGLVRVRTDGERLLVYTDSGQTKLKEAYAFRMDGGKHVPDKVQQV